MNIYSKLRRIVISEGGIYNAKDIFGSLLKEDYNSPSIDNPEFYDIETHTLKLGNLCYNETRRSVEPSIEWNNNKYTTYCSLLQLSNTIPTSRQNDLHKNIDIIYDFLRRDLSLDNRRKFHALIQVIFGYDNPDNTIKLIADFIKKTDSVSEIKKSLDLFKKEDVAENDIEEFLKKAKFTTYKEYENSFVGDHFNSKEYKLYLKYRSETENRTIYNIVKDTISGKIKITDAVSYLYQSILENYVTNDMVKGDLTCKQKLIDSKGKVIIDVDDIVEVKKLDHTGDSYLSEFFSIYKDSKLPKDAFEPKFLNTYNYIIDGLYKLFQSSGNNILEDIKNNFAGIIYSENTFIESKNIELYWSNKGRGSCNKDHRLSIRYRVTKSNVLGYVYEKNKSILIEKNLNIQSMGDLINCPIIKPTSLKESYNLDTIGKLLFEGRKEDAKNKYPQLIDEIFDYYVNNDPSGNQKYLDWLLKNTNPDYEAITDLNLRLMDMVIFFHQNQQMFIEKDINKHTFNTLEEEIIDVKEKLLQKDKKKQAKKQSIKLYEDDRWLVISPKSWEASCYYGAGTKWCITMKDNPNYWSRYSKNASFFFIIDKTKTQEDPLYKVAYRKIGKRGRYELWNAPDLEISKINDGKIYFQELPEELKNRVDIQHLKDFPPNEVRLEWIEFDPKAQALINHTESEDIEDMNDSWHGLSVYEIDGDHYAVGDPNSVDEALSYYYYDYSDSDLIEYFDYEGYYLEMSDESGFIYNEVSDYIENVSNRELYEASNLVGEESELEERINNLESELESEEDVERISELESEIISLKENLNSLEEKAKDIVSEWYSNDWERCLGNGAVSCLVDDKGWFRNARELYNSGFVSLDRDNLISNLVDNADYDTIAENGWDSSRDDDDNEFIIFKIDY